MNEWIFNGAVCAGVPGGGGACVWAARGPAAEGAAAGLAGGAARPARARAGRRRAFAQGPPKLHCTIILSHLLKLYFNLSFLLRLTIFYDE